MAIQALPIEEFIELSNNNLVIDVRSPSEFNHAHFPQAYTLPLFDDEQRKIVGTAYKQISRQEAIKIGLDYFGIKMRSVVEQVEQLVQASNASCVLVHCWRGGMRSQAVAWLLDLYGFKVFTLKGGYKAYRNWVLQQFQNKHKLLILSGFTGSGKTEILHELSNLGHPTIDLEHLSQHKGSAFGALGMPAQPSNEQFENLIALHLHQFKNSTLPIVLESENPRIGNVLIPRHFFEQMKNAPCLRIVVPVDKRLEKIVSDYGQFETEDLKASVQRISKRLGGLETKRVLNFLDENNIQAAFELLIAYYDRNYLLHTPFQQPFGELELQTTNAHTNAQIISDFLNRSTCVKTK